MRIKPLNLALLLAFSYGMSSNLAQADSLYGVLHAPDTSYPLAGWGSPGNPVSVSDPGNYAKFSGNIEEGVMNATANSNGPGPADSTITYSTTVANNTGHAQAYTFNYSVSNISMGASFPYYPPQGRCIGACVYTTPTTGTGVSSLSAVLALNGYTVWNNNATLTVHNDGYTNTSSFDLYQFAPIGATFGTPVNVSGTTQGPPYETHFTGSGGNDVRLNFANMSGTLDLGILNPGQSESISYSLAASAQYSGAFATIGDPFGIYNPYGGTVLPFQVVAAPVPEPETYAMMAAGIALIGGMVRRRKQR